jgi:phosphopantetheine adenylyltransferase
VREIARFGGDVSKFVSPPVAARLVAKFAGRSPARANRLR